MQQSFNAQKFADVLPYAFTVDWQEGQQDYAKQLEKEYYEFPITWTNKPKTDGLGPERSESKVTYKLIAVETEESPRFYLLKFTEAPDGDAGRLSWSSPEAFTGLLELLNGKGEPVLGEKYIDGEREGTVKRLSEEEYETMQGRKQRLMEECYTEITYHYTDFYDSNWQYTSTRFDGITYNEVCTTYDDGSGGPSGGGGTGATYSEYTDRAMPDYLLSGGPWVQYPKNSDYPEKYPKLTEYLRNKLPNIASNDRIVDAILKYTDLTREQIKEELQWGEGTILEIIQLDNACFRCDQNTIGYFDDSNPNTIYLDVDMVTTMEATTPGSLMGDALIFWVGTAVLHEFVHYADHADGSEYTGGEEGDLFEDDVYGQDVTRTNAVDILLKGSKNY